MNKVKVNIKSHPYEIIIGAGLLSGAGPILKKLSIGKDALVITHPVLRKLYGTKLMRGLKKSGFTVKFFEVPEGEKSKSVKTAFGLIEKIAAYDVLKRPFIIALGGGVIGDLAGYVASCYKRGIPFVQIPTTLLGQIDSAIGGKVAIDLPSGKNLVGAFYQPKVVLSDITVLRSLNKRQMRNGLAEAVKYGIIYDEKLFRFIHQHYREMVACEGPALKYVVYNCSRIKADVVVKDEKETKGIRTILNFGHTIGHAIEAASQYRRIYHGEAIALGMIAAMEISHHLKMVSEKEIVRVREVLDAIGLPQTITGLSWSRVLKLMQHDKKFISGQNRFVLARRIGKVTVKEGIKLSVIKLALEKLSKKRKK